MCCIYLQKYYYGSLCSICFKSLSAYDAYVYDYDKQIGRKSNNVFGTASSMMSLPYQYIFQMNKIMRHLPPEIVIKFMIQNYYIC